MLYEIQRRLESARGGFRGNDVGATQTIADTATAMNRRRFIQNATRLVAAASLEPSGAAAAGRATRARPVQAAPPPTAKTVRTNILEIGYHESGNAAGFPVILLHGFPDDA